MKLSLVVLTPGKGQGKAIPITRSPFVIGRDPECQLRPASAMVSKRHCALEVRDHKVFILDFGSTNGTFLNDQQVKGEAELHPKDHLKVGPLDFEVRLEAPAPAPAEKPVKKPAPAKKAPAPEHDDEAAAMLLSLEEDGASPPDEGEVDSEGIPTGGTVYGNISLQGLKVDEPTPAKAATPEEKKEGESKPGHPPAKKKEVPGDTSKAAEALLAKYYRRK